MVSDIIKHEERMSPEVENSICNCYKKLRERLRKIIFKTYYQNLEKKIWTDFLFRDVDEFYTELGIHASFEAYIKDESKTLDQKLDLINFVLGFLQNLSSKSPKGQKATNEFIQNTHYYFKRLNFIYTINDYCISKICDSESLDQ